MDPFGKLGAALHPSDDDLIQFHRASITFHLNQLQRLGALGLTPGNRALHTIDRGIERSTGPGQYHVAQIGHEVAAVGVPDNQIVHRDSHVHRGSLNPLANNFRVSGYSNAQAPLTEDNKSPALDFAQRAAKLNIRLSSGGASESSKERPMGAPEQGPAKEHNTVETPDGGEEHDYYTPEDDDLIDLSSPVRH